MWRRERWCGGEWHSMPALFTRESAMPSELNKLFNDNAVHRRTPSGQAALLSRSKELSRAESRYLGAVTGLTPLRVLLDMGFDAPALVPAISRLAQLDYIDIVEPSL